MGSCVCHANLTNIVDQILVGGIEIPIFVEAEGKLEDLHSRQAIVIPESLDFFRYHSQILSNDRKGWTQLLLYSIEELLSRSLNPLSINGCLLTLRNTPIGFEASEVVDSDYVGETEAGLDPLDPPCVSILFHPVPIVERISPKLTCGGEGIWGNSC